MVTDGGRWCWVTALARYEVVVPSHDVGGGGGVVGDKDDVVEQAGY